MALAFTAVFVAGAALGYVVGRPTRSPAEHGALRPGQVRVPNVAGLTAGDARRVLAPLGLRVGGVRHIRSTTLPMSLVVAQAPPSGTAVRSSRAIHLDLSAGPGPVPGPVYIFARSVLIPINRVGPYHWTSPRVVLDGPPVSLGANTRVIGTAEVTPYHVSAAPRLGGTGMAVSFRVNTYRGAAWYAIVRAFGRQRESASRGPGIVVRPAGRGRAVDVIGDSCRRRGPQAAPLSVEGVEPGGRVTFLHPLVRRVSVYRFRARIAVKDIPGNGSVRFRVGGTGCVSPAIERASI